MLTVTVDKNFLTPGALLLAGLGVSLTPLAIRRPFVAACGYGALFALTVWFSEWRSFLLFAWSPVIVGIVAFRTRWLWAVLPAVVYTYLVTTDPSNNYLPDFEPLSLTLPLFLYAVAIGIGAALRKTRDQRLASERRAAEQREALMTALHDSVAATLTSVVMRSETLALTQTDPSAADSAEAIADDARRAMGEVRDLLRVMKNESVTQGVKSLEEDLDTMVSFLSSHGFVCEPDIKLGKTGQLALPQKLSLVFSELAVNILKYAQPESRVTIEASSTSKHVNVRITSSIATQQSRQFMTTSLGLGEIARRVRRVHGTFGSGKEADQWVTRLSLPAACLRKI
ncbi:histidine kinase [Corynebacterium sp. MSK218]|uniref:sensor histidine kinase n=1 Tax=Corynebacterium sp. MSK218 TaxID=3050218 RepID=UPI00254A123B|nr:histidine kinase [Corynebacterium sp. MSK218]MDK8764270.1 histidine kinase [Corynebacterium sp. MSK218]